MKNAGLKYAIGEMVRTGLVISAKMILSALGPRDSLAWAFARAGEDAEVVISGAVKQVLSALPEGAHFAK